jgi:hypothetical protein
MFTTITRRPSQRTKAFGFDDLIGQGPRVTSLIAGLASTIRGKPRHVDVTDLE